MDNDSIIKLLKENIVAWNSWRHKNAGIEIKLNNIDLSKLDLSEANLSGIHFNGASFRNSNLANANLSQTKLAKADLTNACLSGANLSKAYLFNATLCDANLTCQTNLTQVNLSKADLTGAVGIRAIFSQTNLSFAKLKKANLRQAVFVGSQLNDANFENARLTMANFTDADLERADLTNTNLTDAIFENAKICGANFKNALVANIEYKRNSLHDKCAATKVERSRGNPIFRRDVEDQQYIDALKFRAQKTVSGRMLFRIWAFIDYGRSMQRVAWGATILSMLFGLIFYLSRWMGWGLLNYEGSADSWLTPFYYSVITYTTLGFGDVTPANWVGEVVVVVEVILGYLTLGLLLAVLANTVARRS